MADFTQEEFRPFIRSRIRQWIRAGSSPGDIIADLQDRHGGANGWIGGIPPSEVQTMIGQETRRQSVIGVLQALPKRTPVNLHARLRCGRGQYVQSRITLQWYDERDDRIRTYGFTTTLANQGRLQDILNAALATGIGQAAEHKYEIPNITSSMTGGANRYNIEYIECV